MCGVSVREALIVVSQNWSFLTALLSRVLPSNPRSAHYGLHKDFSSFKALWANHGLDVRGKKTYGLQRQEALSDGTIVEF